MYLQESSPDVGAIIGMIVALIAVVFTIVNFFITLRKASKGDSDKKEQLDQKLLREVFEEFEEDEEEEEFIAENKNYPPKPPANTPKTSSARGWPRPEEKFVFHPSLDDFTQRTKIEDRKLNISLRSGDELVSETLKDFGDTVPKKKEVEIHNILKSFPSKKSFIIASEIIQPPVALRKKGQFKTYE